MVNKIEFEISSLGVEFVTQVNGDRLTIRGFHLTPQQAADLAYLVNQEKIMLIRFKEKENEPGPSISDVAGSVT